MLYSDEDVPSKFVVHLVSTERRGWEGGGGGGGGGGRGGGGGGGGGEGWVRGRKKKSSALFFHLGVSNELFYKKEKRRQDGSWSQGEQRRVMGSLAGFTDGPMRRPAAAQTRSLGELKRITSCNSYCVKAPAASTDTDTHGQRRRRRRTPSVSSRHTTWLSIHVTRSDITARHHRNYRGSRN